MIESLHVDLPMKRKIGSMAPSVNEMVRLVVVRAILKTIARNVGGRTHGTLKQHGPIVLPVVTAPPAMMNAALATIAPIGMDVPIATGDQGARRMTNGIVLIAKGPRIERDVRVATEMWNSRRAIDARCRVLVASAMDQVLLLVRGRFAPAMGVHPITFVTTKMTMDMKSAPVADQIVRRNVAAVELAIPSRRYMWDHPVWAALDSFRRSALEVVTRRRAIRPCGATWPLRFR